MKDLILSDKGVLLTSQRLESIAIFAFKCAVIADHSSFLKPKFKNRELFFSADCRTAFRQSLAIPEGVQMWLAASQKIGRGTFRDTYRPSPPSVARGFELYELTYGVGYLIFQLVATRWLGDGSKGDLLRFGHGRYWNKFCLPLWPNRRLYRFCGLPISSSLRNWPEDSLSGGKIRKSDTLTTDSKPVD